jgi:hypothetical protein
MAKRKSKKVLSKKLLLIGTALLLVVAAGAAYHFTRSSSPAPSTSQNKPNPNPYVNLNPATDQEKQQSQNAKDAIVAQQDQQAQKPADSSGAKAAVTPVITHADSTVVNGYVSGVFENGGTCTATFTKSGDTKSFTSAGFENVSYTSCPPIHVSGLGSGSWALILNYSSSTSSGSSASQTVNVP